MTHHGQFPIGEENKAETTLEALNATDRVSAVHVGPAGLRGKKKKRRTKAVRKRTASSGGTKPAIARSTQVTETSHPPRYSSRAGDEPLPEPVRYFPEEDPGAWNFSIPPFGGWDFAGRAEDDELYTPAVLPEPETETVGAGEREIPPLMIAPPDADIPFRGAREAPSGIDARTDETGAGGTARTAEQPPSPSARSHDVMTVLFSRSLAGTIDLTVIFLSAGVFPMLESLFAGVQASHAMSQVRFLWLMTAIYIIYSLFFIAISNQTIGMMMTGLRVVGTDGMRPPAAAVLARCLMSLPSLLSGVGLIWALIDRDTLCLHDRLSRTRVKPRVHSSSIQSALNAG